MYYQNKIRNMITILVTLTFEPKFTQDGKALVNKLKKASRKEKGCKSYKVKQDLNDENTVILFEKFYDEEGYYAHKESDHVQKILKEQIHPMVKEKVVRFIK